MESFKILSLYEKVTLKDLGYCCLCFHTEDERRLVPPRALKELVELLGIRVADCLKFNACSICECRAVNVLKTLEWVRAAKNTQSVLSRMWDDCEYRSKYTLHLMGTVKSTDETLLKDAVCEEQINKFRSIFHLSTEKPLIVEAVLEHSKEHRKRTKVTSEEQSSKESDLILVTDDEDDIVCTTDQKSRNDPAIRRSARKQTLKKRFDEKTPQWDPKTRAFKYKMSSKKSEEKTNKLKTYKNKRKNEIFYVVNETEAVSDSPKQNSLSVEHTNEELGSKDPLNIETEPEPVRSERIYMMPGTNFVGNGQQMVLTEFNGKQILSYVHPVIQNGIMTFQPIFTPDNTTFQLMQNEVNAVQQYIPDTQLRNVREMKQPQPFSLKVKNINDLKEASVEIEEMILPNEELIIPNVTRNLDDLDLPILGNGGIASIIDNHHTAKEKEYENGNEELNGIVDVKSVSESGSSKRHKDNTVDWEDKIPMDVISYVDAVDPNYTRESFGIMRPKAKSVPKSKCKTTLSVQQSPPAVIIDTRSMSSEAFDKIPTNCDVLDLT